MAQLADEVSDNPHDPRSNPMSSTAKKKENRWCPHPNKFLGVRQKFNPHSAVEARRKHRQSLNSTCIKSE